MSDAQNPPRTAQESIAPALADYTSRVLFGDVWERPGLSKRDRSLITVATLVALYRTNELPFHLKLSRPCCTQSWSTWSRRAGQPRR